MSVRWDIRSSWKWTRDGADRKSHFQNVCPLSALHQQLLSAVRTATAFVVHFPVHIRTAPQTQSFTPQQQLPFVPTQLKHCAAHDIFFLGLRFANKFGSVYLLRSVYFASLANTMLELFYFRSNWSVEVVTFYDKFETWYDLLSWLWRQSPMDGFCHIFRGGRLLAPSFLSVLHEM